MGPDPLAEPPFFFHNPATAPVQSGATLPFPPATNDLDHEAELGVALQFGGADLTPDQALAWFLCQCHRQ